MEIRRGDLVTIALPGDYGKPRPALVVQSDAFVTLNSVTVLRLTSALVGSPLVRIDIVPSRENGLVRRSQIMVDKMVTTPRGKIGQLVGRIDSRTMWAVDAALKQFLGLD